MVFVNIVIESIILLCGWPVHQCSLLIRLPVHPSMCICFHFDVRGKFFYTVNSCAFCFFIMLRMG